MLKDMYGKVVSNGDFMSEGHEDHAYIFEVRNNKPVLVARLGIGQLEKYSLEDIKISHKKMQEGIKNGVVPSFMNNYYKTMLDRMEAMTTESLCLSNNNGIFEKFVKEEHESITYTSQLSEDYINKTIAYFPDIEMVVE